MAMVLIEGWDFFDSGELALRGWVASGSMNAFSTGRFGVGKALNLQNRNIYKGLPANYVTVFAGAAVTVAYDDTNIVLGLLDNGSVQVAVRWSSLLQTFYLTRGSTTIGTATGGLAPTGTSAYVELGLTIDNASGSAELRVNGKPSVITFSGDTQVTANAYVNQIYFQTTSGAIQNIDDIYVNDNTGGSPTNTFLGDILVETDYPSGNGNSSQFVGSDANSTDNYLLVDEHPPNADTDYVESSTVGDKDTYAFSDLGTGTGTVYAVQTNMYARKTSGGTRSIKSVARLSATETDGAEQFLGSTYAYYSDIRETKPGGGVWAISDVNSAEFGVKVIS